MDKNFYKFSKAVYNESDRERLYGLYRKRKIFSIIFFFCTAAVIILGLIIEHSPHESRLLTVLSLLISVIFIVSCISMIYIFIKFSSEFRKILTAEPKENEPPEVIAYRKKLLDYQNEYKKTMNPPCLILIFGTIYMVAVIIVDMFLHPETEDLTALGFSGMIVFAGTFFYYFIKLFIFYIKNPKIDVFAEDGAKRPATENESDELKSQATSETLSSEIQSDEKMSDDMLQSSSEASAIQTESSAGSEASHTQSSAESEASKSQGSNKTADEYDTLSYLYPNPVLYGKASELNKARERALALSLIATAMLMVLEITLMFILYKHDSPLLGMSFPISILIVYAVNLIPSYYYALKLKKVERMQKQELDTYKIYEKNLEIYNLYKNYSKGKGLILPILLAVSVFLVSFILAIIYPKNLVSIAGSLVIYPGLLLNNKFYTDLKRRAKVIEDEIDSKSHSRKFKLEKCENDFISKDIICNGKIAKLEGEDTNTKCCFVGESEVDFLIGFDNKTKQVNNFILELPETLKILIQSLTVTLDSEPSKLLLSDERDYPENFCQKILFKDTHKSYIFTLKDDLSYKKTLIESMCCYDPEKCILLLGEPINEQKYYKIFNNLYVQLKEDGKIASFCIENVIIGDIQFPNE